MPGALPCIIEWKKLQLWKVVPEKRMETGVETALWATTTAILTQEQQWQQEQALSWKAGACQ